MHQYFFVSLPQKIDVEAPCLVTCAVAGAADLAILLTTRDPNLKVKLTIGCSTQLLSRHVKKTKRELQFVKHFSLYVNEFIHDVLALLRTCKSKHLDFLELVQSVKSSRLFAVAGFFAKAVADCNHFVRQGFFFDKLISIHACQRYFRCADQTVFVLFAGLQLIYLARGIPCLKSAGLHYLLTSNVRRRNRNELSLCQFL